MHIKIEQICKTTWAEVKQKIKDIRSIFVGCLYELKWEISKKQKNHQFLNNGTRKKAIIVSLTSFPGRINTVHKTIRSILNQARVKPDRVELWLAREQFEKGKNGLPVNLLELQEYGLEIRWCEDIRSFKKLLPTLKEHSDSVIVTADDDVFYKKDWLEKLVTEYEKDTRNIYCHKATMFYLDESGRYMAYGGGEKYYKDPSFLNKLVGVGGVLYPPGVLNKEIFNEAVFQELAPTNDDIWFWFMAILNKTKIKVVEKNNPRPVEVYEREKSDKLTNINDRGENLFWIQFDNLIRKYAYVDVILRKEFERRKNQL